METDRHIFQKFSSPAHDQQTHPRMMLLLQLPPGLSLTSDVSGLAVRVLNLKFIVFSTSSLRYFVIASLPDLIAWIFLSGVSS